jgi:SpoVK/Ycf46/Vps4 family AAA+-type ATPase
MAPCFLLLDNLEIILGSGGREDETGKGQGQGQGVRSGRRTAHQALDRLLSTLLVEIDGLGSSRILSKVKSMRLRGGGQGDDIHKEESDGDGDGDGDGVEYKPVIVIATTCDISLIDR